MFCTECGCELRGEDRFCSRCGRRTAVAGPDPGPARRLMLDKRNKKVAGVCSGLARYLDADVTLVRIVWLILLLGFGVGLLGYIAAWIIMPSDHGDPALAGVAPEPAAR